MRALVQRVSHASVDVDGKTVGQCGRGLLILVCAMKDDTEDDATKLADKLAKLRIFPDENGRMNRSIVDISGSTLVISQFTLAADTKGNRPGFSAAADPKLGKELYEQMAATLAARDVPTQTGIFGADMAVSLTNDGPVTIWLDTRT